MQTIDSAIFASKSLNELLNSSRVVVSAAMVNGSCTDSNSAGFNLATWISKLFAA